MRQERDQPTRVEIEEELRREIEEIKKEAEEYKKKLEQIMQKQADEE